MDAYFEALLADDDDDDVGIDPTVVFDSFGGDGRAPLI